MNNAVVIAGGPWQKPFVKYLKGKGHHVAVVNPIATETTDLADYHIKADVSDLDEINRHLKELKPLFITSDQSDISTMTVARLCKQWGVPGNSPDVVERFTDKFVMHSFGKSIGVPVPNTMLALCPDDVRKFAERNGLPIIIKPADATNSRGFRKLESLSNIDEDFHFSKKFSKSGHVIVQQFIAGKVQVTLDGVCSGGKHRTLATSRKGEYFKPGLTSCVRYPSNLPLPLLNRIIADNDRYVESAGMNFGITHGEYIVDGDDYCLIEIAGRGAGAGITDKITPWVSGIHPYDVLYASLIGEVVDVKSLLLCQRPGILQFYHEDKMVNCDAAKAERIAKIPGVAMFQFDFRSHQFAVDAYNPRHTMGIYLADSEVQLDFIINNIADIICKKS